MEKYPLITAECTSNRPGQTVAACG